MKKKSPRKSGGGTWGFEVFSGGQLYDRHKSPKGFKLGAFDIKPKFFRKKRGVL